VITQRGVERPSSRTPSADSARVAIAFHAPCTRPQNVQFWRSSGCPR
jgi:hypothetical protein